MKVLGLLRELPPAVVGSVHPSVQPADIAHPVNGASLSSRSAIAPCPGLEAEHGRVWPLGVGFEGVLIG